MVRRPGDGLVDREGELLQLVMLGHEMELREAASCFFFQAEDGIRDGHVTGVQTCALPISPVRFVFTYLFPKIGQEVAAGRGISFATVLLPGLVAVSIMFQGIATVALPLAIEFGTTREIEDRVMTPLPVSGVALAKIVFSTAQSVLAAAVVFPLVYFIPATPVHVHVSSWPLLVLVVLIGGFVSGAMGLTIGTLFKPNQIGLIFAVIVVPTTFLGCVYYPWAYLAAARWLQILVLLNPLVYMSEGLRAALTPELPHMPTGAVVGALALLTVVLTWAGIRGFLRRVLT